MQPLIEQTWFGLDSDGFWHVADSFPLFLPWPQMFTFVSISLPLWYSFLFFSNPQRPPVYNGDNGWLWHPGWWSNKPLQVSLRLWSHLLASISPTYMDPYGQQTHDTQHKTPDTWHTTHNKRHMTHDTRHKTQNSKSLATQSPIIIAPSYSDFLYIRQTWIKRDTRL